LKKYLFLLVLLLIITPVNLVKADFPVEMEDDLDQQITLAEKPNRIISLAPANTEILFALGLADEIVGVSSYANYPEPATKKEKIGSITEVNLEKVVALKPDLIVASGINRIETIKKLRELGYQVAGFYPQTVNDIFKTIKDIGKLTGKDEEANKLTGKLFVEMSEIMNLVEKKVEEKGRQKIFYEIWSDPLITAGENTFIDDLIEMAGGINIGAYAQGMWPQYSLEKLILENPAVFISSYHSAPQKVTIETIKERRIYQQLKAVKNNRIYLVNQDLVSRAGPRIIEGLREFVKALHPELADEVNKIVEE